MESLTNEVGARIRLFRKKAGLSQESLAEKADLHYTYIGQVERGEKNITITSLGRILFALNISFSDFFEAFGPNQDKSGYAMRCYNLVNEKTCSQQEKLFRILLEIVELIEQ